MEDNKQENQNLNQTTQVTETPTTHSPEQKENKIDLKTIMPTMVDTEEDEKEEKKVDLSAIIPKSATTNAEGLKIESRDAELKADGSIVLGTVQGEGIAMAENAQLPEQIDVEERRKEAKAIREGKIKPKKIRDVSKVKKEMRNLNKKTVIALVLILLLAGSVIYILKSPKAQDFQVKQVRIELGEGIPLHAETYVTPAFGQRVDDLTYKIDTSSVDIKRVGQYQFTVTHNGVVKIGILSVVDTTPPEFTVKDLVITEGTDYAATDFVQNCTDLSGCNYDFEEQDFNVNHKDPDEYIVRITATDSYGNKSAQEASLRIEERGKVKYFIKETTNDEDGYKLTTKIELHFIASAETTIILNGEQTDIYEFVNEKYYKLAKNEKYGLEGVTTNDDTFIITEVKKANKVGDRMEYGSVLDYLSTNGYRETDKDWK